MILAMMEGRTMADKIRFWHFSPVGDDVLIKIRKGQTLRHYYGTTTDEGWHSESNIWHFDGNILVSEWMTDGRDCDGRLQQIGESSCPVENLRAGYVADNGIVYPKWEQGESSQRDYSAEAMGY